MGKMYMYDILLLYKRYTKMVDEDNENDSIMEKKYEEQYDKQSRMSDITNQMNKMTSNFSPENIARSFGK